MSTAIVPPSAVEIERRLLAAVVIDQSILAEMMPQVEPRIFYAPSSAEIWKAICKRYDAGDPIDLVTISSDVNGVSAADIATWAEDCLPSHWPSYLGLVKKLAFSRSLLSVLTRTTERICDAAADAQDALAELVDDLVALQRTNERRDFEPVTAALLSAQKLIERAFKGAVGIQTGLRDYDQRIGGLQPTEVVIVAGRPGMGKTALAQQIAVNAARKGHGAAFASLEMSAAQIGMRLLSGESGLENRDLRRGRLQESDFARLVAANGRLSRLNIQVLDSDRSWKRLKAKIRALKLRQPDIALVVLDYVGLIDGETNRDRYLEIGKISAEAKELAKVLNVAVILCAQLNRLVESRADKKPQLSDLPRSGNLEQDADVVLLLHRPSYYDQSFNPPDLAYLDVAKNRHGPTGQINLRFEAKTVSFSDWEGQAQNSEKN